jgi:hypothetical protein
MNCGPSWKSECRREVVAVSSDGKSAIDNMESTCEQLWDAVVRIGTEDGTADRIQPAVIVKLTEFKMVEVGPVGLPQLTHYGTQCFTVMESGDCIVRELMRRYWASR